MDAFILPFLEHTRVVGFICIGPTDVVVFHENICKSCSIINGDGVKQSITGKPAK